nr:hypothetical protein [Tanacetum cinerariifolium]
MRRLGKGFSRVETPLFEGMLVDQEADEEVDAYEHVEEVIVGDDTHGDDSATHGEVPTRVKKLEKRKKVRVLKLRSKTVIVASAIIPTAEP